MSIKAKLLQEINKKAQKIRDKRVEAASNKTIDTAVYDFFRNIEESRKLHDNKSYDGVLFDQAKKSLESRIKGFDAGAKIAVEFNATDSVVWEDWTVRGVTVWWSAFYIAKHKCDPSVYIDVGQMLFS